MPLAPRAIAVLRAPSADRRGALVVPQQPSLPSVDGQKCNRLAKPMLVGMHPDVSSEIRVLLFARHPR